MLSRSFVASPFNVPSEPPVAAVECGLMCICDRDPVALIR